MTYTEALDFHVREFDRQVADLREIMMRDNYDNDESPEVIRLRHDILKIVKQTFILKQCHTRATDLAKAKEAKP
jgi:hypothetical protein